MDAWLLSGDCSLVTLSSCIYHVFLLDTASYCSRDFRKSFFILHMVFLWCFFRLLMPYIINPTSKCSTKRYCSDWKESPHRNLCRNDWCVILCLKQSAVSGWFGHEVYICSETWIPDSWALVASYWSVQYSDLFDTVKKMFNLGKMDSAPQLWQWKVSCPCSC